MSRLTHPSSLAAALALIVAAAFSASDASAHSPGYGNAGFLPFGFYQPYGAQYSTSMRTPPYFATNPPVYYGARHARPYGLSPFASPPMVSAGPGYHSRLRSGFQTPHTPTPTPVLSNPCIHTRTARPTDIKLGKVQFNPFVGTAPHDSLASRDQ